MSFDLKQLPGWLAIVVSLATFFLYLHRDILAEPKIEYSLTELTEYPGLGKSLGTAGLKDDLSITLKRAEVPDFISLKYGLQVHLRSVRRKPASNVQIRIKTEGGAFIIQTHTDERLLVERLPDLGRQGAQEVFINIPLMVQGEEVKLTFWYGIPNSERKPPRPTVLLRHTSGLGVLKKRSSLN